MTALIEMRNVTKEYRGVAAVKNVNFSAREGRDPRARRRKRRRQVDADQDHGRRHAADQRRDAVRRQAGALSRRRPRRCRDGVNMVFQENSLVPSMTVAQNLYLGDEKFFNRLRGALHRRAAVPAVAELQRRSVGDRRHARRGEEADGRDRARGAPQRPRHHLRRADRLADARGEASFLLADAPPQGARRFDHLHLARAGGGAGDLRPHHRPARRRARDHRRDDEFRSGQDHPRDGRPQPVGRALQSRTEAAAHAAAASACSACRTCRWARWCATTPSPSMPGRSPAFSG